MRIYISEIKRHTKVGIQTALPFFAASFNCVFWVLVGELRSIDQAAILIGMGLPAAISASLSLFLIQKIKQKYWWYGYSLFCVIFVQIVLFVSYGFGIKWGSEAFWFSFSFILQLPTFYVLGIGIRKSSLYLLRFPPALLRKLNIHLIPDGVEDERVFKYEGDENSSDVVHDIENKLKSLNDNVQKVSAEINSRSKSVQNDANDLLSNLYVLKNEYVSVHKRLEANRLELSKLEHLRNLSEEQVDSILSRMDKTKVVDWIIGFILGFFASFLVQMFSGKIPRL